MSPEEFEERKLNAEPVATPAFLSTDTKYQCVGWIETYTGRMFSPLDPKMQALSILDIAHALSNQCRYAGHTRWHYSTAQHCVLLANYAISVLKVDPMTALQILMHDAPEAYLVDMPRPVKQFMPEFRVWDHAINDVIRAWMGWTDLDIPKFQDEIDSRIIADERDVLFSRSGNDWGKLEPLGIAIDEWTPQHAEKEFLLHYAAYSHAAYGQHMYLNSEWNLPMDITVTPQPGHDAVTSVHDLVEVDIRGGVGRVKMRTDDGMLVRDRSKSKPEMAWTWWHGDFHLQERAA